MFDLLFSSLNICISMINPESKTVSLTFESICELPAKVSPWKATEFTARICKLNKVAQSSVDEIQEFNLF